MQKFAPQEIHFAQPILLLNHKRKWDIYSLDTYFENRILKDSLNHNDLNTSARALSSFTVDVEWSENISFNSDFWFLIVYLNNFKWQQWYVSIDDKILKYLDLYSRKQELVKSLSDMNGWMNHDWVHNLALFDFAWTFYSQDLVLWSLIQNDTVISLQVFNRRYVSESFSWSIIKQLNIVIKLFLCYTS